MVVNNGTGSGLIYPESLEQWQKWQDSKRRLQRGKAAVTHSLKRGVRKVRGDSSAPEPSQQPRYALATRRGESANLHTVIGIDSNSPTAIANCVTLLPYLSGSVSVLHPSHLKFADITGPEWTQRELDDPVHEIADVQPSAVVSLGHFLGTGAILHRVAREGDFPEYILQHGALTPYAPPLPEHSTLLAWTEADAAFWTYRRPDVETRVVGSQHLWEAAQNPLESEVEERPVFLGQLHGTELPRRISGGSAWHFCAGNNGLYRPHPREEDLLSRTQHALWRKRGMEFADTSIPLRQMPNQVVAVFSTGLLEAAVRGVPSWVYAVNEPQWVREFWDRYGMKRWGSSSPTPLPAMIDSEPATHIARIVEDAE